LERHHVLYKSRSENYQLNVVNRGIGRSSFYVNPPPPPVLYPASIL